MLTALIDRGVVTYLFMCQWVKVSSHSTFGIDVFKIYFSAVSKTGKDF